MMSHNLRIYATVLLLIEFVIVAMGVRFVQLFAPVIFLKLVKKMVKFLLLLYTRQKKFFEFELINNCRILMRSEICKIKQAFLGNKLNFWMKKH